MANNMTEVATSALLHCKQGKSHCLNKFEDVVRQVCTLHGTTYTDVPAVVYSSTMSRTKCYALL